MTYNYDCYMRRLLRCLMDVRRCDQNLRTGAGGSRSAARPGDEELAPQRANVWSPHWFGQEGDAREAQLSIHHLTLLVKPCKIL